MSTYTYSAANDTAGGEINPRGLHSEISNSSITIALDSVTVNGDVIDCVFKASLSPQEQSDLTAIVSAHDGEPSPQDPPEVKISEKDPTTIKGIPVTNMVGPENSYQQTFETEWRTATLNSIHEKNIDNQDIGWSSLEFYKDVGGVETKWTPADQADLDSNCIRTDMIWNPDIDYWILSGEIGHHSTISENLYVWASGSYSVGNKVFVEGGINLKYLAAYGKIGVRGAAVTHMQENLEHPQLGTLDANKIRVVCRHSAGKQHDLQLVLGIFRL